jgi:hypothetical protein
MELAIVKADVVCTVHVVFVRGVLQRPVLDGSGLCVDTLPGPEVHSPDGAEISSPGV